MLAVGAVLLLLLPARLALGLSSDFSLLYDMLQPTLQHRAANSSQPIIDGEVMNGQVAWGETDYWLYQPADTSNQTVYFTLNICSLPFAISNHSNSTFNYTAQTAAMVPGLSLYSSNVSTSALLSNNQTTKIVQSQYGFANITYTQNTGELYFAVQAPPKTAQADDSVFAYQIGLSTARPLHAAFAGDQNRFLFLQDSDFSAALLTTGNLSSADLPDYSIWINPSEQAVGAQTSFASIQSALKWSWCGITTTSAFVKLEDADRTMTTRGPGGIPQEQFYVHDLVPSTFYDAYITLQNNYSQGGVVWPAQSFRTRDTKTCQVIYNLDFCGEVAYSVPSNGTLFNPKALGSFYDTLARDYYSNFSTALQTFNCNTTDDAQYSLVSNCTSCRRAYHDWVCATTIPRCADLTNPAEFLVMRPANTSRNPAIDATLIPGAYKEVLPCQDLVQNLVRTCPVSMDLRIPLGKALTAAYGVRSGNATVSCNAPGVDFWVASSLRVVPSYTLLLVLTGLALLF